MEKTVTFGKVYFKKEEENNLSQQKAIEWSWKITCLKFVCFYNCLNTETITVTRFGRSSTRS